MLSGAAREARRLQLRQEFTEAQCQIHLDADYPKYIYHYAPMSSIRSILQSREIWLFDTHSMQNDSLDGRQWIEIFRQCLNRFDDIPVSVTSIFEDGRLYTHWCYSLIACFSSNPELPQQWEDFADHGKGCAIEFSLDAIRKRSDNGRAFAWTPMLYGERDQIARAEQTIETAIKLRRRYSDLSDQDYWSDALFSFLCCGTRFKPEKYRDQDEWRIVMDRPDEGEDIKKFQGRAYIQLPLTDLVTGVVRGPNCEWSEDELASLLKAAMYPLNIRTVSLASTIALR